MTVARKNWIEFPDEWRQLHGMERKPVSVVWTNDDLASGRVEEFRRQLDFLNRHEVRGVFFVIPGGGAKGTLDNDVELMREFDKARAAGHEFYQHGFLHYAYECGIPELGMLKLDPAATRQFDEKRFEVEALHTFEALVKMLEDGQRIWRRAFGENSAGFRPGWGAYCSTLYRALSALGYKWVSSRLCCTTSWLWNAGEWDAPINFRDAIPTKPTPYPGGVLEVPLAGDYAFRVPPEQEKVDAMVNLGIAEFEEYQRRGDPMLIVSHYHGLQRNATDAFPAGTGYAVHEKLIPALKERGAKFCVMKDIL